MTLSAYLVATGLSDVGYQFYTESETTIGSRVTSGVLNAGEGWYSAAGVTIPANASSVRWDSSGQPTIAAREYFEITDPWALPVPNGYPAGSAGSILARIPDVPAGSVGGLFIAGSNAPVSVNISGNLIGDVTGSVDSVVNAPTDASIAAAVRDVSNASPPAGSLGADVKTGAVGGDPWATVIPGAYGAGTAGNILGSRLDVQVTTRLASADFIPAPTSAQNAAATRDVNNTSPAPDSLGAAINSAASAGDPWSTVLPGAYGTNTAGKIIGERVDALVSSRLAAASYVAPPTPTIIAEATRDINNQTPATNSLGAAINAAAAAGDPWQTPLPGSYPSGSAGKLMSDNLDAKVSTRLPTSSYVVPPTSAQNAAATRDVNNQTPAANSLGAAVNSAASAGDPWGTLIPGAYTAGTAGKILGDNVDAKISAMLTSASYVPPPSTIQISEAVRDVDNTNPASNSLGEAINEGSDDPWGKVVPGSYPGGTAGKILGDNLDVPVSSRSNYAGNDTPGTLTLLSRIASVLNITSGKVDVNDKTGFSLTSAYDAAKTAAQPGSPMTLTPSERTTLAAEIWNTLTSALITVGSIGKWIVDRLDATVSSRLPTTSYVAPDNAGITAIKTKTDALPVNVASVTDIPTPAQNAAATRDVSNATPAAGSLGADVKTGAVGGDPWTSNLPGTYPAGTAGNILGARLDTNVSTRLAADDIELTDGKVTVATVEDKSGYSLVSSEATAIADEILKRDWNLVTGEAGYSVLNALRFLRDAWEVKPDGTLVVYKENGQIAWQRSVTSDPAAEPIVGVS